MKEMFCQSCGMPLEEGVFGTEKDGGLNTDYCKYCYENGAFTSDCTMEEMIQYCVPFMATEESGLTKEQAEAMMREQFPMLKRWK